MSNEVVDMGTVRIVFNTILSHEKELQRIFKETDGYIGAYACEKVIEQMTKALNTLEKYKVTMSLNQEIA